MPLAVPRQEVLAVDMFPCHCTRGLQPLIYKVWRMVSTVVSLFVV